MKVCLLSTGHDARDDRFYFKEARSLAKQHDVTVIAPWLYGRHTWDHPGIHFTELRSSVNKLRRVLALLRVLLTTRRGAFDVIHVVDIEAIPIVRLLRWRTRAKVVCDIWEANYELLLGPTQSPSTLRRCAASAFRAVERWTAAGSDLVLTADPAIAEGLGSSISATVIFNYPLLTLLTAVGEQVDLLRSQLGDRRFIVYHGSMGQERGVLEAVEAIAKVRREIPSATLLLVGVMPAQLAKNVRTTMNRLGVEDGVLCPGWIDHSKVGRYLHLAEIGLVPFARTPKFAKNIPQKIFEYWAVGIPVVATDLEPIRHYVSRCGGGVLTPTNDPTLIAEAVVELLSRPALAAEMGEKGRAAVESAWNWAYMEEELLAAYSRLSAGEYQRTRDIKGVARLSARQDGDPPATVRYYRGTSR